MILKLQQLEKEIDKILKYFTGDDKRHFITNRYILFLENILKLFKEHCHMVDFRGDIPIRNKKEYCFNIPKQITSNNAEEENIFESWFKGIFYKATRYNSIEDVTRPKISNSVRNYIESIVSPRSSSTPISSSNSKRRRTGGTRKRRRTKRKRNKRKKNLKKSYKK